MAYIGPFWSIYWKSFFLFSSFPEFFHSIRSQFSFFIWYHSSCFMFVFISSFISIIYLMVILRIQSFSVIYNFYWPRSWINIPKCNVLICYQPPFIKQREEFINYWEKSHQTGMRIFCYGVRLASEINQLISNTKSGGFWQIWIYSVKDRLRSDYRYRSKRIPLKVFTGSGSAKVLALLSGGPTGKCIRATMSESSTQQLLQVMLGHASAVGEGRTE